MSDALEESLRDLLNRPDAEGEDARLARVLRRANRQVGLGDLFGLVGNWHQVLLIAMSGGSSRVAAIARRRNDETIDEG